LSRLTLTVFTLRSSRTATVAAIAALLVGCPAYEAKKNNWRAAILNLKGVLDKYGIPFPAIPEVGITGQEVSDIDMEDIIPVF
jgi:hypothetical protein